jgi:hypothetical protein
MARHSWNADDACVQCGLYRSGFQGGRTGSLTYYSAAGSVRRHAGPCTPMPPMLVETALRRAAATRNAGQGGRG